MRLREHVFLGTTQSLCPDCLQVVPAKILVRGGRVYFRKRCGQHGVREDFVCSDAGWFDRLQYSVPGKVPPQMAIEPRLGCPYDCGLCSEHEQHTCIGLLEITSSCNLTCPLCFAASAPGGSHLSLEECRQAIDHLVAAEGQAEILQLSGGEPTIHPQFDEVLAYACERPIDIVMINTNGIRFARDDAFLERVARWRHRTEIYLQLDGLDEQVHPALRGEPLLETKLRAVERLGEAGLKVILVCTLQGGVNESEVAPLVEFGLARPWVTGVSFQPATYSGRYVLPETLERRVTFPDVIHRLAEERGGTWREDDFMPLPCAHPNAHALSYAYRSEGQVVPLARFVDVAEHLDLLAGGITFNRPRARRLIEEYISRQTCGDGCGCGPAGDSPADNDRLEVIDDKAASPATAPAEEYASLAREFLGRALAEELSAEDVFRVTITSFMDAYNFDLRQLMKSCVHHVLPSGHIIPFSAYNVLYREGHVPLPPLRPEVARPAAAKRPAAPLAPAVPLR